MLFHLLVHTKLNIFHFLWRMSAKFKTIWWFFTSLGKRKFDIISFLPEHFIWRLMPYLCTVGIVQNVLGFTTSFWKYSYFLAPVFFGGKHSPTCAVPLFGSYLFSHMCSSTFYLWIVCTYSPTCAVPPKYAFQCQG